MESEVCDWPSCAETVQSESPFFRVPSHLHQQTATHMNLMWVDQQIKTPFPSQPLSIPILHTVPNRNNFHIYNQELNEFLAKMSGIHRLL